MPHANFIYIFFILFLTILLSMLVMFEVMVHSDPDLRPADEPSTASDRQHKPQLPTPNISPKPYPRDTNNNEPDTPPQQSDQPSFVNLDLTALYRANLFAIDLCLIVLAEALLIILFVKYTLPAAVIGTIAIVFLMTGANQSSRSHFISNLLSGFVTNRYATLSHTDMVLLTILSGLIMAFLVSVLLKQGGVDFLPSSSPGTPSQSSPTDPHP
jgi:hypothetical protein